MEEEKLNARDNGELAIPDDTLTRQDALRKARALLAEQLGLNRPIKIGIIDFRTGKTDDENTDAQA